MHKMTTEQAVAQLTELMTAADSRGATFLIGAGLSEKAGIPLARQITRDAHKRFASFCAGIDPASPNAYGLTMGKLSPPQRRVLLQPYFDKARINWGQIALAHLMKESLVPRVMSVNFDSVLARACGLLGLYPAIYDFGAAPVANVKAMAEPAIIHLHGQSFGFVQLNTEKETGEHAAKLAPVVRECVQGRPLVVVGYSGQSDGVMEALCACYDDNTNLYWVDLADKPSPAVAAFFEGKAYAGFVGEADGDRFLVQLAQSIAKSGEVGGNWTPRVFHDPLQHLLDEMAPVTEFPTGRGDQKDDVLSAWRADVVRLRDEQKDAFRLTREAESAAIQGETGRAAEIAGKAVEAGAPSVVADRRRYWEEIGAGNELSRKAATETGSVRVKLLHQAAETFARASELDPQPDVALYNWGNELGRLAGEASGEAKAGLLREACGKYEAAVAVKPDLHEALYNWGVALSGLAEEASGEAKADLLREACGKYEAAVAVKPDKHEALFGWGVALVGLAGEASGEAKAGLLREACGKYEAAVAVKPDKHEALNNWGSLLLDQAKAATGDERSRLMEEAAERLMAGEKAKPGSCAYNLACLTALTGLPDAAHAYLLLSHEHGELPDRAHLEADTDLDAVRGLPWFAEVLALAKE
jgi:tetratricopeptide (TPR) repeat protein